MKSRKLVVAFLMVATTVLSGGAAFSPAYAAAPQPVEDANGPVLPVSETSPAAVYSKLATMAASYRGSLAAPSSPVPGLAHAQFFNLRKSSINASQDPACEIAGNSCSLNWAGLEFWNDTFTGISAEWKVPHVSPAGAGPEDTSTWIGLNGDPTFDASGTLLQVGTDAPSEDGSITYEAWYELYPGAEIPLFPVSPGDQVQAAINQTSTGWSLAISDLTTGIAWSSPSVSYSAVISTAEFTEEDTTVCPTTPARCTIGQLQDFGSATFTNIGYTFSNSSNSAHAQQNYMVDQDGNVIAYPTVTNGSVTVTFGSPSSPAAPSSGPTAGEGSISGTVWEPGGTTPAEGVCVFADNQNSTAGYFSTTGPEGTYLFADVVPGSYTVIFDPTCRDEQTSAYAFQVYEGGSTPLGATPVVVNEGENTALSKAVLQDGATIEGTVDGPGGQPAIGVCIDAYSNTSSGYFLMGSTVETGTSYTIGSLPATGTYTVRFDPTCSTTESADASDAVQFYNGSVALTGAQPISVPASGIDANLVAGATITGTVTAPSSAPGNGENVCVTAYGSDGYSISTAYTNPDGSYSVGNLTPGNDYELVVDPTCSAVQPSDYSLQDVGPFAAGSTGVDVTLDLAQGAVAPSVATTSLPAGTVSKGYVAELAATNGLDGYIWTATGLPPGLSVQPGGLILGTPTAAGTYTATVTAFDSSVPPLASASEQLTLTIAASTSSGGGGVPSSGGGGAPLPVTTTTVPTSTTTPTSGGTPGTSTTVTLPPGTPSGIFGTPVTTTVGAKGARLTVRADGATATVTVPAEALPTATRVGLFAVKNPGRLLGKFSAGDSYLISFALGWRASNGTSPAAKKPITLTITDPSIKAGDIIYILTPSGVKAVGVATANGKVTVRFENDPDFLVANIPQLSSVATKAVLTPSAVEVKVGCKSGIRCVAGGTVTAVVGKGKRARSVMVAQGRFTIPAGKTETVSLRKTAKAGTVLVANPKKQVVGTLSISLAGGKKTAHRLLLP